MSDRQDSEQQELIKRIADGSSEALRSLHELVSRPLFSLALKMLSSRLEAEEVVQDVFVSVWKNARKFEPGKAKVFTWMTVLTRNKCIDKIRTRQRRIPTADTRDDGDQIVAEVEGTTAADELAKKERLKTVKSALNTLPPEQQEAVELAFFKGLTYVQVAERLGISIGTAKSRIRYAFQRLRGQLKPDATYE